MTGTFSSLNTALSALRYQRVAMDVASNNIANVTSEGYTRRRAEAHALGAPNQVSMWSRYDGVGDGVSAASVTRLADPFLDARSRREHGTQSYLDTRVSVLDRLETGIGEPGDDGVTGALADFRNAWQDLQAHPEQGASRSQVLATGRALAEAVNGQARNVDAQLSDQRGRVLELVTDINTTAKSLAAVNRTIAAAQGSGLDDSDLKDQRDVLAMRLSELTGAQATARPDGGLDLSVAGVPLVVGQDAGTFTITGGVAPDGSSDGNPLAFAVVSTAGSTAVSPAAVGGETGATSELLTTTLPGYRTGLDAVASVLADSVNSLHTAGYDLDGDPGTPFFSYDPLNASGSLAVAITDPDDVAASSLPGGVLDGGTAEALGGLQVADGAYQRLVTGLASEVGSSRRLGNTQRLLTTQVDASREQLGGVNFDEETTNLMAAQRAYEAAARVLSTMDSVLDTLINRTGLVR